MRDVILAVVILLFGASAALVIAEPWRPPAPAIPSVRVAGKDIATGSARPAALVELVREKLRSFVALRGPGFSSKATWADLGAEADLPALGSVLVELGRKGSAGARYNRDDAPYPGGAAVPLPVSLSTDAAVEALVAVKETIDRQPESARFDIASQTITDAMEGRSLDVYASLDRLDEALRSGASDVELAVDTVKAAVNRSDLQDIDVSTIVGFFETPHSRMAKDKERTHNLKLGASMLDGHVILPGQVFSVNGALGDRTEARGFRYAPVIAGGVLVEGMGGGTCQIASTLNGAAFFAGLVTMERRPHSRPSSYIKLGLDATVVYPDVDLKLKNPFDFPLVIHYTVENGTVRAEFRGRERPYTVTFLRKIMSTFPFAVHTVDDPRLPRGKEVSTQNGIPGFLVRRNQIIERNKIAYRHQTLDKYPPTSQVIHRGTGEGLASKKPGEDAPKPDPHPPYEASTYLRMVQGAQGLWYESSHE
ncbi:MAG: VanW family protein [Deltaproteobacteria bacterium]|nr:VanW family protein [Deltaproteobacteria bacterium]